MQKEFAAYYMTPQTKASPERWHVILYNAETIAAAKAQALLEEDQYGKLIALQELNSVESDNWTEMMNKYARPYEERQKS